MPELPWDLKGLWIPKEILFADGLLAPEMLLLTLIYHLDNERGCYASNQLFAKFLDVSERQVTRYVSKLQKKGYVSVVVKNRYERTIRMKGKFAHVSDADLKKLGNLKQALADQMTAATRSLGGRQVSPRG